MERMVGVSARWTARILCWLFVAAITACGGGGGGGGGSDPVAPPPPPAALTFSPSSVTINATAGTAGTATLIATPAKGLSGTLFIKATSTVAVVSDVGLTANADGTYTVNLQSSSSLTAGTYTGNFTVAVCRDAACANPVAGSPVILPYTITIASAPAAFTFTPATITGIFVQGTPFPFDIVAQANASAFVSGSYYVTVNDATGTFLSTASLGYLDSTRSNVLLLQVQARSNLVPGTYTGSLSLTICNDSACQLPVPGSPVTVPFSVTVTPAPANAGLTSLTPWPGVAGWTTYQGNSSHTGFVPVTLDPAKFAYRWVWEPPRAPLGLVPQLSTLTVSDGQIYMDVDHVLYALKEFDNSTLWSHDFSNMTFAGVPAALNPPAVSGATVYVTTSAHTATAMFGLAASNGTVLFQTPMSAQFESYLAPTIQGGIVYNDGGTFGGLYAFDATTGAQDFLVYERQYDYWTPAVDAHYAYAYTAGVLTWVNNTTGAAVGSVVDPTWAWPGYDVHGAPVLGAANSVIVGTLENSLIDVNTSTQALTWSAPGPYAGNPGYANGVVFAIKRSPVLLEVRSETDGLLQWTWSPPTSAETDFRGDVLVTNNLVFLSTNTTVYAIDTTTHQSVWSAPTAGYLALSENGVLYIVEAPRDRVTAARVVAINVK